MTAIDPSMTTDPSKPISADSNPPDHEGTDQDPLSTDMTFEILKNWRRRQVLRYLETHGGDARLDDLAEHIAALENGIDERALSSSQRKRVYIALYQCHLPKMDDVGVVEYEQARGRIRLRAASAKLFRYLDLEESDADDDLLSTIRSTLGSL